jgi:hypothetical protein
MTARQTTARQTKSASYEVGYGKPPRRTQFRKGQSGNPGGRPRGRPIEYVKEMALQEAYRTVIVKQEDGHAVPMSAVRAVLRSQFESAAGGNARAQCAVLAMIRELETDKAFDARNPQYRRDAVIDAAADRDDADHDGADDDDADDDEGEADTDETCTDETCTGEIDTDEIDTDAETQQEERAKSAAPPSSANSTPAAEKRCGPGSEVTGSQLTGNEVTGSEVTDSEVPAARRRRRGQEGSRGEASGFKERYSVKATRPEGARAFRLHGGSPEGDDAPGSVTRIAGGWDARSPVLRVLRRVRRKK